MLERPILALDLDGGLFDQIAYCRHHPKAEDPREARCWCRKPSPGMVIAGVCSLVDADLGEVYPTHMSMMVGDRPEDEECAKLAGYEFMWAKDWRAQASEEGNNGS